MKRASSSDEFERTYRLIRRKIVSGDIPPGTRIIEAELGDRLDVSRTPIRSALIRLRSEDFLEGAMEIAGQRGRWEHASAPA